MSKALLFSAISILAAFALACSSGDEAEEEVPVEVVEASGPCCTTADIIKMHTEGLNDAVLLAAVETTEQPLEVTIEDILLLSEAGVSETVIIKIIEARAEPLEPSGDELLQMTRGGVSAEIINMLSEDAAPKPAAVASPPTLSMSAELSNNGRVIRLSNSSTDLCTSLRITVNGEYYYSLKKIPPKSTDSIRISSFKKKNGQELSRSEEVKSMVVRAKEGVWSHRF